MTEKNSEKVINKGSASTRRQGDMLATSLFMSVDEKAARPFIEIFGLRFLAPLFYCCLFSLGLYFNWLPSFETYLQHSAPTTLIHGKVFRLYLH